MNDNPLIMRISYNIWMTRLATCLVWIFVGAIAVFWALKTTQKSALPVASVVTSTAVAPDTQAVARAFGQQQQAAAPIAGVVLPAAPRLALVGVLSGRQSGGGAALIAVDGKPAQPYRVGAEVAPGMVLQYLDARVAKLGGTLTGPTLATIEMPPLD